MRKRVSYCAACVLLSSATSCRSSSPADGGGSMFSATIQAAGYAGLVAAGPGLESGRWSHDALVGYVPATIGGEDLWSLTIGTSYGLPVSHHHTVEYRAYVGASLHCSFDDDTFWSLPDMYPDGYYMPTALRTSLSLGLEVRTNRHAVYIEVSSLDIALVAKARSWWDALNWEEVVTLGVGYRFRGLRRGPSAQE